MPASPCSIRSPQQKFPIAGSRYTKLVPDPLFVIANIVQFIDVARARPVLELAERAEGNAAGGQAHLRAGGAPREKLATYAHAGSAHSAVSRTSGVCAGRTLVSWAAAPAACAARADGAGWTRMATAAAVVDIRGNIDARAVANDLASGAHALTGVRVLRRSARTSDWRTLTRTCGRVERLISRAAGANADPSTERLTSRTGACACGAGSA
jgi:hypothetical protein